MQQHIIWHRASIILGILSLLTITYTTILLNNFKTPEATTDFLKNSNAYYYISEIIKISIRSNYTSTLQNNVIELAAADAMLNAVVSPSSVERIALPALKFRQKIAQLPTTIVNNDLVLNTKQYTQQLSGTISSLQLPPAISDAANNLIASIPTQITVVDTSKHPNSVAVTITKTRILFEHIQTIRTISWIIFLLSLAALILSNVNFLRRFLFGLFLIFLICGGIGLLASYAIPAIYSATSSNPDPLTGVLKDNLWDSLLWYYFSLTRIPTIVYLLLAGGLYIAYRYVPVEKVKAWAQSHIPGQPSQQPLPAQPQKSTSRKKR